MPSRFQTFDDPAAPAAIAPRFAACEVAPWPPPPDARPAPDPYESGALFHGPAFQLLRSLSIGQSGASAELEAGPRERLLDALTHAIPHDALRWSLLGLTLVVMVWAGRHFYVNAWAAFRHHSATMDTLVSIATWSLLKRAAR